MYSQVSSQRSQLSRYVSFLVYFDYSYFNRLKRSRYLRYSHWISSISSSGDSPAVTWASGDITTVISKMSLRQQSSSGPVWCGLCYLLCPVPARSEWTTDNIARHFLRYSSIPTTSAQDCCSQVLLIIVQILKCLWSLCAFHCMKMLCVAGNFNAIISILEL